MIVQNSYSALTVLALVVLIGAVLLGAMLNQNISSAVLATPTPVPQSIPTQVAALQNETITLRKDLDALSKAATSNPNSSPDLVKLRADLKLLDDRLSVIEKAVIDNPERALQLTLLSREMENLKITYRSDQESIRKEIERIYDFNKWFIGLMFTMALSVVGLAVTNLVAQRKSEKGTEKK